MDKKTKDKIKEASSGLKKLTTEQEKAILELWSTKSDKMQHIEKLVHKSVLYKLTNDIKYAPKANRNQKAEELNQILFS